MADHNKIRSDAIASWDRVYSDQVAHLSILIILEQALASQGDDTVLKESVAELTASTKKLGLTPINYLRANLFFGLIAAFELFILECAKSVISQYPKKVGAVQFRLSEITDAGSVDSLVERATDVHLNNLFYKKPAEYLDGICELLSINLDSMKSDWLIFVEAKARRDLGIHNDWRCNSTYIRKVTESGSVTAAKIGDQLIPDTNAYLFSISDANRRLADFILDQIRAVYV